ncbi:MAG: hypothetical protein V1775_06800 [Bacteroidota bacterium]
MKKFILLLITGFSFILFSLLHTECSKKDNEPEPKNDTWDIDKDGIPEFITTNYIELDKVHRISKFRSSQGHDYSDGFESCRSMKHYFEPKSTEDWGSIKIYSPVTGKITRLEQEWAGTRVEIVSDEYPAFRFSIFHITLSEPLTLNGQVTAGQQLGTHVGSQTMSDIAVLVNDPTRQGRMVSYFETITDAVFELYRARGLNNRDDIIISKAVRDANPLTCNGDSFVSTDVLENWITLN